MFFNFLKTEAAEKTDYEALKEQMEFVSKENKRLWAELLKYRNDIKKFRGQIQRLKAKLYDIEHPAESTAPEAAEKAESVEAAEAKAEESGAE